MPETAVLTLTDFLLARVAEDEAVAKKAAHLKVAGPLIGWHPDSAFLMTNGALERVERDHIARHDPARVLADCKAKRRIVELVGEDYDGGYASCWEDVLRLLAAPYADHPDWREEWRP